MDQRAAPVLCAIDDCIEKFTADRKQNISPFIEKHFSVSETIQIQKRHLPLDLILSPVNALWSIPYLMIKKAVETSDKMGWPVLNPLMDVLPASFKTGYQKDIEKLIATELVGEDVLMDYIRKDPVLGPMVVSGAIELNQRKIRTEVLKEIEKYTSSQAMISDVCSSLLTLAAGWIYFGDKSLGVMGLGSRFARKMAREKASSNFFLGEKVGSVFYGVFPPAPTNTQIVMATLAVGALLTVCSLFVSVMIDPARKRFGMHDKKLHALVDNLEERLFIALKKDLKSHLRQPAPMKQAG
ncbi:DUF6635 family protein [Bdellovibrio bacteriovorus]|uniref:DUF6635 family protein n=1 Tax=Bdellovibrio bacteriovorus TaxID=959 RepID=UPI003D02364B